MLKLSLVCLALMLFGNRKGVSATTIDLIEQSIRSEMNQGECRLPQLPLDTPEIMKFYESVGKINCGSEPDWVTCEQSICSIKPKISAIYGDIKCSYTDIIRTTDYTARLEQPVHTKEPYVLKQSDFVKVACQASTGQSWDGMAHGIRDTVRRPTLAPQEITPLYNVLMFGFDSLSRNAFMRKLPRTYAYLTEKLGGIVLKGYNIVGDGTPQALIPLLTGYTELELPETRKRMPGSSSVSAYPMIWRDFARLGYVTAFNEDMPDVGTFTYRMNGFDEQPTDHYLRTYYMEALNSSGSSASHCIGNTPDHLVMLNYTTNFMLKYQKSPRFVFSFHGGLSHDSINLVGAADDDTHDWLVRLKEQSLLEDTILIVMADHGNRFAEVRATLQGKQEERLPFFSFAFPESFKQRFPKEYENFVANQERLSTPFDVHATLEHLIRLQMTSQSQEPEQPLENFHISDLARSRAKSLFQPIPSNRSCADAYIEPHWCACLNWIPLQLNDSHYEGILLRAAHSIVDTINLATSVRRQLCVSLQLSMINWALRLEAHKELLQFRSNADPDGFIGNFSGHTLVQQEIYQLQILTQPGQALYEASVAYNLETLDVSTKISDISRVNKYGTQANCIYERDPELRKFCYCRE